MASCMFRTKCRHMFSLPVDRRNLVFHTNSIYKARHLSDNRVIYHTAKGQSDGDVSLDDGIHVNKVENNSIDTDIGSRKKLTGRNQHTYLPRDVTQTRKQMQNLHNLPDFTDLPAHPVVDNQNGHEYGEYGEYHMQKKMEQDEDVAEPMDLDALKTKFTFLREQMPSDMEKVVETSFGLVRFDRPPLQEESEDLMKKRHNKSEHISNLKGVDYVDDQYFSLQSRSVDPSGVVKNDIMNLSYTPDTRTRRNDSDFSNKFTKTNNSDKKETKRNQFNPSATVLDAQILTEKSFESIKGLTNIKPDNTNNENIFDEQYFKGTKSQKLKDEEKLFDEVLEGKEQSYADHLHVPEHVEKTLKKSRERQAKPNQEDYSNFFEEQYFQREFTNEKVEFDNSLNSRTKKTSVYHGVKSDNHDDETPEQEKDVQVQTKQEIREAKKWKANLEEPKTPHDLAMKIRYENKQKVNENRSNQSDEKTPDQKAGNTTVSNPKLAQWRGKVDSKGYRILTDQVLDLKYLPRDVVVKILRDSILYEDDDLLAIYKPYGLPSHGGPGVHHSVGQLLDPLLRLINPNLEKLYLVHRLDKETTGVMLLAKTQQSERILHNMFVKQQVIKKYWLLTNGIPNPSEGVIDIPMAEGTVMDKSRMTLRPESKVVRRSSHGQGGIFQAVTNYKVLDSSHETSLVQCQPESGVKHQIRCHMAFALHTPILGDHKYSHYSKLAPQKLHWRTLERLKIRQAKVRHLAMHLHAKQIILPQYKDGKNLSISANLPKHFVQNMKWLQLKRP